MNAVTVSGSVVDFRQSVRCHQCRKVIFDGEVVKARVVRVLTQGAEAKCQCKAWVPVPLGYQA